MKNDVKKLSDSMVHKDGFRLVLEVERFEKILDSLTLGGLISSVDIALKKDGLFSSQLIGDWAFRVSSFKTPYFLESVVDNDCYFSIDARNLKKTSSWLSELQEGGELAIEQKNGKLYISTERDSLTLDIQRLQEYDNKALIPFERGVSMLKNTWKFDTHFEVNLVEITGLTRLFKKKQNNYLTFSMRDRELFFVVWSSKNEPEVIFTRKPVHEIFYGRDLSVTFSESIKKIMQAFSCNTINIHAKTGKMAWFSEESKD